MVIFGDYHTHTTYSHGKGGIIDNAIAAKNKGLKEIAITDHGFSHKTFGIKRSDLKNMIVDCEKATKATGVKVLLGVEENLISLDGKIDINQKDLETLQIVNAG